MPSVLSIQDGFVIVVMAAILLIYIQRHHGEVAYVQSGVDGRRYLVRMLPDRQEAADRLARLNASLQQLVAEFAARPPPGHEAEAQQLLRNYDPGALSEGGTEVGYTSYSVNKGERIVMCLRHRDLSFVDGNVLMYVAIHELGHLMTVEVGHTQRFWDNFRALAGAAIRMGLYTRVDYAQDPQPYCGITIASSVV